MKITREISSMGGKARADKLSPERRKQIAAMGGKRIAEINRANALAAMKLNEISEGVK